ncbi:(Na+)-NQR maturation NqrM [Vibrio sp. Of7-15]|uniref:(Na+)-NQR maturation NqrM n=1 Tax=Vibrio sp. Of7-15 TaxID=2724879 RepID=UPI001EF31B5A|nr:(Na+)-NQR maturation NqrM [Vibrio sp. Of7-15]MCG7499486.1 (Na+)-NQR maturation NqrM [Vibrio sp. Of7-15]
MTTFLVTFAAFLLVIAAMAVGYIFQRKVVKGSCGGLGAVGIEKECNCPEPCDARLKREAREARQEQWKKDRIV